MERDTWNHGHYRTRFTFARTCEECLGPFHATRWDAKTCGPRCRKARSRRLANGEAKAKTKKRRK